MGFHSKVLDTVEVMEHVSALLQGHWSLLRQFNEYLSMVENVVPVAADSSGRAGRLRLLCARLLAQGCPLGPRGEPSPLALPKGGCVGAASGACPPMSPPLLTIQLPARRSSDRAAPAAHQHGQTLSLAAPKLNSRASSGRA